MDVPTEIVAGIVVAAVGVTGSIIIFFLKSLRDEFRNLSSKLETFGENLAKVDVVVTKVLLTQSICPNCPHTDTKVDTELLLKAKDVTKEEE